MGTQSTKAASAAPESLEQRFAKLEAENARLKAAETTRNTLSVKLGASGGISLYGMGRFPVTLYGNAWERLFGGEVEAMVTKVIEAATDLTDANGQPLLATKGQPFVKRDGGDGAENAAANAVLQAALLK